MDQVHDSPYASAGWAWLGPAARHKGWAPGPIEKQSGAAGWILWVSLAIMLGDSMTSLSILMGTSTWRLVQRSRYTAVIVLNRKALPKYWQGAWQGNAES